MLKLTEDTRIYVAADFPLSRLANWTTSNMLLAGLMPDAILLMWLKPVRKKAWRIKS